VLERLKTLEGHADAVTIEALRREIEARIKRVGEPLR
jgi:hypothetical protein